MEYEVVIDWSLSGLTKEVNKYLSSGWQLQGGIAITYDRDVDVNEDAEQYGIMFAQALVKSKP